MAEKSSSIEGQKPTPALSVLETKENMKSSNFVLFRTTVFLVSFPSPDLAAAGSWCFAINSTSDHNRQITPARWSLLSI